MKMFDRSSLAFGLAVCLAVGANVALVWASTFGLDMTDEGYYMNSILWAVHYKFGVSGFGSFYQILFELVGGSWGLLRMLNAFVNLSLFGLFALLAANLINEWKDSSQLSVRTRTLWFLFGGLGSAATFHWWLPTPSYNSLAWQGALVFGSGLLGFFGSRMRGPWWILTGFGLTMSFVAKPPTALALVAILAIAFLPWSLKAVRFISLSGLVSFATLLSWAYYLDGGLGAYLSRMAVGLEQASELGGGQLPLGRDWWNFVFGRLYPFLGFSWIGLIGLTLTVSGLVVFLLRDWIPLARFRASSRLWLPFSLLSLGGFLSFTGSSYSSIGTFYLVTPAALVIVWAFASAIQSGRMQGVSRNGMDLEKLPIAVAINLLPLAFAIGTGNNYFELASAMQLAFLVGSLLLLNSFGIEFVERLGRGSASAIIFVGALTVCATLGASSFNPYRQASPVYSMKTSNVVLGVHVDSQTEEYLAELSLVKRKLKLTPGIPILDNSGASPLAILALGGLPIGSGWLIGGYEGSENLALFNLALYGTECREASWILDEPRGERRIFALEEGRLVKLRSDYDEVARFTNPLSGHSQVLYRPIKSEANSPDCRQFLRSKDS
jgi:hypothetical protein